MIQAINQWPERKVAVIDEAEPQPCTYCELRSLVGASVDPLRRLPRPGVVFLLCSNSLGSVVAYLAALQAQYPVTLLDPGASSNDRLIAAYRPSALLAPCGLAVPAGFREGETLAGVRMRLWLNETPGAFAAGIHPALALMLTSSGSTGNPKVVRLTAANLTANADSIAEYLALGPEEISIQSLPMHYSYGLSLVNSHLLSGGTLGLTNQSFMRPEFWGFFDKIGATSFAGVPYMYETLQRLRLFPTNRPTLRTMTQAGGHLRPDVVRVFHAAAEKAGKRFFVMYGQTEATARISYVPPPRLGEKIGTIGIAIPRGKLSLSPVDGCGVHELIYEGPNVMMGDAQSADDLALGDVLQGRLVTGDLAERDADGFFRITGRLARFAKLFGKRVQLADVEAKVENTLGHSAAAIEGKDCLEVFVEGLGEPALAEVRSLLAAMLGVPPASIHAHSIAAIPMTASGKKDYKELER